MPLPAVSPSASTTKVTPLRRLHHLDQPAGWYHHTHLESRKDGRDNRGKLPVHGAVEGTRVDEVAEVLGGMRRRPISP